MVFPMSTTSMPLKIRNVSFTPAFSRIRSANPLPVTMPMRAFISCTTSSTRKAGNKVHSRW